MESNTQWYATAVLFGIVIGNMLSNFSITELRLDSK